MEEKNTPFDERIRKEISSLEETPVAVPGWDEVATWDKLEAKLHPKKKRAIYWWWGAAAGIALLLGWIGMYGLVDGNGNLGNTVTKVDSTNTIEKKSPFEDKEENKIIEEAVAEQSGTLPGGEQNPGQSVSEISLPNGAPPRAEGETPEAVTASSFNNKPPPFKEKEVPQEIPQEENSIANGGDKPPVPLSDTAMIPTETPVIEEAIAMTTPTTAPTVFNTPADQLKNKRSKAKKLKVGFGWMSQKISPSDDPKNHNRMALAVKTNL